MSVREIIYPDNPILRRKANKVRSFDDKLQQLIDDLLATLDEANGVGLAAPQIAVSQRVILVRLPNDEEAIEEYGKEAGQLHIVVNPELARKSENMVSGVEACLSIPGYFGDVDRHVTVTVKGLDLHGKKIRIKAREWLARIFQHEIDHLDGVLYIDHATDVWRAGEREDDRIAPAEAP